MLNFVSMKHATRSRCMIHSETACAVLMAMVLMRLKMQMERHWLLELRSVLLNRLIFACQLFLVARMLRHVTTTKQQTWMTAHVTTVASVAWTLLLRTMIQQQLNRTMVLVFTVTRVRMS